jgi:hypothetical protein
MTVLLREAQGFDRCPRRCQSGQLTSAVAALLATSALTLSLVIAMAIVSIDVVKVVPTSWIL